MSEPAPLRVLIADDQRLFRDGLRTILASEPDLEVVGEAGDGHEAVELAVRARPDVVLMDVRMPGLDGVAATRRIREAAPSCRVVILSTYGEEELLLGGLRAGAAGYLLKDTPAEELVRAVRAAARGEVQLQPPGAAALLQRLALQLPPGSRARPHGLTERELEVLQLVASGRTNREIAAALVVSEATVKTHLNNIFGKLGLQDRAQAVIFAYQHGLVPEQQ